MSVTHQNRYFTSKNLGAAAAIILLVVSGCGRSESGSGGDYGGAAPARVRQVAVAVAPIEVGLVRDERIFSGTLVPSRRFTVAARSSALLEKLDVEIGDRVKRGQTVGQLDSAEAQESVLQAEAEVAVARANLTAAKAELEIAQREVERVRSLRDREFVSEAERDRVESRLVTSESAVAVTQATLELREATLRLAKIRLDQRTLRTAWEGHDLERFVSRRFVDEGTLVSANSPILEVVSLDPLIGQFFLPEADYFRIVPGVSFQIESSAHRGETFTGQLRSRSPEFSADSRRALIEVTVPNREHRLSPGVFVRARVVLDVMDDTILVPAAAVIRRGHQEGVFVINEAENVARFRPVERGFRDGDKVSVEGIPERGWVVVLGQDQLTDGTPVSWRAGAADGERRSGGDRERGR